MAVEYPLQNVSERRIGLHIVELDRVDGLCFRHHSAKAAAHHWAREMAAIGHEARLIPPDYVKPYVVRQKNDAADAAAIVPDIGGFR